jgi:ketosteroid isomerase-like protein
MVANALLRTFRSQSVATLLAALLVGSFAHWANAQSSTAADELAIAEFNRKYLEAINGGDIGALAALTTDDHMMISSGGAPLAGKKALVDAMTRAFQNNTFKESWEPQETVVSGDLAYQRGTFVVEATPKASGEMSRTTGNFLRIFRKINGTWFMVRDTFNSQRPRGSE